MPDNRKSQEKPDNHHKKDEYCKNMEFYIVSTSLRCPGPMPGGKQGEERQGSNEGQSNDARNADPEGDVELPPLDFENEENSLSDDNKNSGDNSGSGGSESGGSTDG